MGNSAGRPGALDSSLLDGAPPAARPDEGWRSLDFVISTLSNRHRRYALYHLQEVTTATVDEVVQQVAEWEAAPAAGSVRAHEHLAVDFHHRHLPKLVEANLIEYDPRDELLQLTCPKRIETILDLLWRLESPDNDLD